MNLSAVSSNIPHLLENDMIPIIYQLIQGEYKHSHNTILCAAKISFFILTYLTSHLYHLKELDSTLLLDLQTILLILIDKNLAQVLKIVCNCLSLLFPLSPSTASRFVIKMDVARIIQFLINIDKEPFVKAALKLLSSIISISQTPILSKLIQQLLEDSLPIKLARIIGDRQDLHLSDLYFEVLLALLDNYQDSLTYKVLCHQDILIFISRTIKKSMKLIDCKSQSSLEESIISKCVRIISYLSKFNNSQYFTVLQSSKVLIIIINCLCDAVMKDQAWLPILLITIEEITNSAVVVGRGKQVSEWEIPFQLEKISERVSECRKEEVMQAMKDLQEKINLMN